MSPGLPRHAETTATDPIKYKIYQKRDEGPGARRRRPPRERGSGLEKREQKLIPNEDHASLHERPDAPTHTHNNTLNGFIINAPHSRPSCGSEDLTKRFGAETLRTCNRDRRAQIRCHICKIHIKWSRLLDPDSRVNWSRGAIRRLFDGFPGSRNGTEAHF